MTAQSDRTIRILVVDDRQVVCQGVPWFLNGKPDPEGYRRALTLLNEDIDAAHVLVLEDTEAGVASAKDAGLRCIAVLGTLSPDRLLRADEIVERVDVELMERLLA